LHGWLDNAASFDRLAPLLHGLRLVAVDLPGHGLSQHRPAAAAYDFVGWIVDAFDLADELGWRQFAILGHSLGGMIGLCAAGTIPERITRVVSMDSLGPLTREADEVPAALAEALKQRRSYLTRATRPLADLEGAARFMRVANPALDDAASMILAARGTRQTPDGFVWRADPRLRSGSLLRLTEAQVMAFLRRVACPALILRAVEGWPALKDLISRRLPALPDAEVVEVPGSHHAHLVNPEDIAPIAAKFLGAGGAGR